MAWSKAEPTSAAPVVASDTLLFAASLNFCHRSSGPVFVARSGKNTDFLCKKDMLLCTGLFPCCVVRDCTLVDGASGAGLGWLSWVTASAHSRQQVVVVKTMCRIAARRGRAMTTRPWFTTAVEAWCDIASCRFDSSSRADLKTFLKDIPDDSIA
jgi:hypothetical protein